MLEIMLPHELRTQKSNEWHCKRWSMYRMGHVYSTVCVCTCLCCGVARLTTIQISQHTPWGSTLPKKKTKKNERNDKRKRNDHPLEPHKPKCDQPKHPKNFPQSKPRSKNTNVLSQNPNPAPTKFRTPVLKRTTLTSHPHIQYPTPLISDQCNWMRLTTKKWISNLTKRFTHNCWHFEFDHLAPSRSQLVQSWHQWRTSSERW